MYSHILFQTLSRRSHHSIHTVPYVPSNRQLTFTLLMAGICVTSAAITAFNAKSMSEIRSEDFKSIIARADQAKEDIETLLDEATVAGKRLRRLEAWNDFFANQSGVREKLVEWNNLQAERKQRFDRENVINNGGSK